jgi:CubicO group peptidase (beta-lactamase class C family)
VPRGFADLDAVLRNGLSWPVANLAFAVIDHRGHEHFSGDTEREFALASVTKLFTALATLVACEEGICTLDEPVACVEGATVRDLLCHAAGLPFEGDGPRSTPRTRRTYSSLGYEYLGELVAQRAGFAFADYVHEAVCEPLGMQRACLAGSPGSAMVASAIDVARLAHELRRPTLLAPETWQAMITPQYPALEGVLPGYGRQQPNPWGLGPEIRGHKTPHWSSPANSPATFGHFGRSGTLLWVDPVADIALVALADREFGAWAIDAWPRLSSDVLDHA